MLTAAVVAALIVLVVMVGAEAGEQSHVVRHRAGGGAVSLGVVQVDLVITRGPVGGDALEAEDDAGCLGGGRALGQPLDRILCLAGQGY